MDVIGESTERKEMMVNRKRNQKERFIACLEKFIKISFPDSRYFLHFCLVSLQLTTKTIISNRVVGDYESGGM